jgi:pimeloyl-ACP methyl ester carboxylesterase
VARLLLFCLFPAAFLLLPAVARADLVIFRDGFLITGKIKQDKEIFVDPLTKAWFTIGKLNGFYMVDDGPRRVIFAARQVADATRQDISQVTDSIRTGSIVRLHGGSSLGLHWEVDRVTKFDLKKRPWERDIILKMARPGEKPALVRIEQRITALTPHYVRLDAKGVDWNAFHLTSEFSPEVLKELLDAHMKRPKVMAKLKLADRRFQVFRFLLQAGCYDEAEQELDDILKKLPEEKKQVEASRETLNKLRALRLGDQIELAYRAGQHKKTGKLLARFAKFKTAPDLIGEQRYARMEAIGERYKATAEKIEQARRFLKALSKRILRTDHRPIFMAAAEVIREDLNQDTLGRIDSFIGLAAQEERDRKNNKRPKQTPEELMSLAVSGWLMGNDIAETNVDTALGLWRARQFVLEYLKTGDGGDRRKLLADYQRKPIIPVDEMTQMIRFLPPPEPEPAVQIKKLIEGRDLKPRRVTRDGSAAEVTKYYLRLPPEYHHQRAYPVLVVLHAADEEAKHMLQRWGDLAAQNGYILAAPEWNKESSAYHYSEEEHANVLDVLHDLRRHFQVDSDRVFLFGFEEGGNMAYDVGLAHPDLFAGVIPMVAWPKYFAIPYRTNAQYLPFYVVDGSFNGYHPKFNRKQFQDWVRSHYPSIYVEYKGRGPEWFQGELPLIFDWMSYKKRAHPNRQLGRDGSGGYFGEEFCTMREGDNRFYWLTTNSIQRGCLNDYHNWKKEGRPARLTAWIGGQNNVYVNTLGVNQVSIWFAPAMINFEKRVTIRVNRSTVWNKRVKPSLKTLLNDLYKRGDRQRLFLAKVDVKLK